MATTSELGVLAPWVEELMNKHSASYRESAPGEPELKVQCANNSQAAHALLSDLQNKGYVHLADLTAYDEYPQSPRFHVVYELVSLKEKKRCSVIAVLSDSEPTIVTLTGLWNGANWLEREVYDMFGIHFDGHPDLRRILLPPSFQGFPLKKDFIVDYRQDFEKTILDDEGVFDPFGTTLVKNPGGNI